MRKPNPGNDYHRRQRDAEHGDAQIQRNRQRTRNAAEWRERGNYLMAALESPLTSYADTCRWRDALCRDLRDAVMDRSRAPWSEDGVRT